MFRCFPKRKSREYFNNSTSRLLSLPERYNQVITIFNQPRNQPKVHPLNILPHHQSVQKSVLPSTSPLYIQLTPCSQGHTGPTPSVTQPTKPTEANNPINPPTPRITSAWLSQDQRVPTRLQSRNPSLTLRPPKSPRPKARPRTSLRSLPSPPLSNPSWLLLAWPRLNSPRDVPTTAPGAMPQAAWETARSVVGTADSALSTSSPRTFIKRRWYQSHQAQGNLLSFHF